MEEEAVHSIPWGQGQYRISMPALNSLVGDSAGFRNMADGERILDYVEERLRSLGATHLLMTGLPLPGRPIDPLVLRVDWGELRHDRLTEGHLDPADPLIVRALTARCAFFFGDRADAASAASPLLAVVNRAGIESLAGFPVHKFNPYQGGVFAAGLSFVLTPPVKVGLKLFCSEAFRRLIDIGYLAPDRPGDLSARERTVVELSATGRTAGEIAGLLTISQRTVHAHLQNASTKLRARNKTQTVVEALRYGQISV